MHGKTLYNYNNRENTIKLKMNSKKTDMMNANSISISTAIVFCDVISR